MDNLCGHLRPLRFFLFPATSAPLRLRVKKNPKIVFFHSHSWKFV
jgi:hypothetical protein